MLFYESKCCQNYFFLLDEVAELPLPTNIDGLGPRWHHFRLFKDGVAVRLLVGSNRQRLCKDRDSAVVVADKDEWYCFRLCLHYLRLHNAFIFKRKRSAIQPRYDPVYIRQHCLLYLCII